jgi:GTP cyclohydrolase I
LNDSRQPDGTTLPSPIIADEEEFDEAGPATLAPLISTLISSLGEDVGREGLLKTPERVERSLRYLTRGYRPSVDEVVNGALFEAPGSEMIVIRDIEFYSLCEHHMLPFFGRAHVAYIPGESVLGLSKFARVVDVFARRLQLQERLTGQVADELVRILRPLGLAVVTEAHHLCMMMRGVEKQAGTTVTNAMRGSFQTDARTRQEFFSLIRPK